MTEKIRVEIPGYIDIDDIEELRDYLNDEDIRSQMYPAFDLYTGVDERAVVDEIGITSIEENSDGSIHINYEFAWSAYYGCKDMNAADIEERYIEAVIEDRSLVLDRFVQPQKLAPNEEF